MDTFTGLVRRRRVAQGSKSEHEAVMLVTPDDELILRRRGGRSFGPEDPELVALVGKTVSFVGVRHGTTLIVSNWDLVPTG